MLVLYWHLSTIYPTNEGIRDKRHTVTEHGCRQESPQDMRRLQEQIPRRVLKKVLQRRRPHRRNTVKEQKPPAERQEGSRPPRRRYQPTARRTGTWRYTVSNVQPRNSLDNVREPKPLPWPRWQATCQILL